MPSARWFKGNIFVSPDNKNLCKRTERRNQDWSNGEFRDLARVQRHQIRRRWAVMGREQEGAVGLEEIS